MNAADSETVARVLFVGVFPCGLSYADPWAATVIPMATTTGNRKAR